MYRAREITGWLVALAAVAVVGPAGAADSAPGGTGGSCDLDSPAGEEASARRCGETPRLYRRGKVLIAGQPGAADLELLQGAGVRTVINLRKATETDWDEAAAASELGLDYANLAFMLPTELDDALLDEARRLLSGSGPAPVLLHCGSANRASAVWLAYRVLDEGADYETALAEAEATGLATPAYAEVVRAYIRRQPGR